MVIKKTVLPRIILLLLCGMYIFIPLPSTAKRRKTENNSEQKTFYAEWKINGGVKKLYNTPLGAVYKFIPTNPFLFARNDNEFRGDNQLNSIQFELYKNSKERKKMKRYIVIGFKIRVFPAIAESKNPRMYFVLTRSMNGSNSIQKLRHINGQAAYNNNYRLYPPRTLILSQTYRGRGISIPKNKIIKKTKITEMIKQKAHASLIYDSKIVYEVISMRIIIDTSQEGIITTNVNENLYWSLRRDSSNERVYPVRSFGILVTDIEVVGLGKSRRLLELSPPKVTLADTEEEIQELPPVDFVEYPYDGYMTMRENTKKRKRKKQVNLKHLDNPDEIYGNALHLLKGKDLIEGVKLLTYIAKKKEHILAMKQLGVCYWRGIGVKKDIKKAVQWFNKAGEYKLSEALKLGGLVKLRDTAKPYIADREMKKIFHMLKDWNLKKRRSIHDTGELRGAYLFNNMFSGPKRSPKSDYWDVRNNCLGIFYKHTAYYTASRYVHRYINGVFKKVRTTKNDIEELKLYFKKNMKKLDKCIEKGLSAAIYYKGQLLIAKSKKEERESALREAMALFKRGEKLGDIECAIEVLHCNAQLGLLKPEDFDDKTYMKFSDHPLYYILKYIVKNPNAPGVKEFLKRDYKSARQIWQKKQDGISHFLLALEGIYQYYHYGADTLYFRVYYGDTKNIKEAYNHLDAAIKANIRDAIYLKGVYLLNKKCNSSIGLGSANSFAGINLLRKVAPENIKALYYLIKYDFYNNKRIDKRWLKQLKTLRDLEFPGAWLLSSDILARLSYGNVTRRKNVIGAYKKAASLGCIRAWDKLARLYYRNAKSSDMDKAASEKYWKKFVEEDKKLRCNDPWDLYWPKFERRKLIKPLPDGSIFVNILGKKDDPDGYKILYKYLKKYYTVKVAAEKGDERYQILKGGPRDIGPLSDFEHSKFK